MSNNSRSTSPLVSLATDVFVLGHSENISCYVAKGLADPRHERQERDRNSISVNIRRARNVAGPRSRRNSPLLVFRECLGWYYNLFLHTREYISHETNALRRVFLCSIDSRFIFSSSMMKFGVTIGWHLVARWKRRQVETKYRLEIHVILYNYIVCNGEA